MNDFINASRDASCIVKPLTDTIKVPYDLLDAIDQLVTRASRCTGERPENLRRAVELRVLRCGIERLQEELSP